MLPLSHYAAPVDVRRVGRVSARPRERAGDRRCRDLRRILLRLRRGGRAARTRTGSNAVSLVAPRATRDTARSEPTVASGGSASTGRDPTGAALSSGDPDRARVAAAASRDPDPNPSTHDRARPSPRVPPGEARLRGRRDVSTRRLAHRPIHLLRRPRRVEG